MFAFLAATASILLTTEQSLLRTFALWCAALVEYALANGASLGSTWIEVGAGAAAGLLVGLPLLERGRLAAAARGTLGEHLERSFAKGVTLEAVAGALYGLVFSFAYAYVAETPELAARCSGLLGPLVAAPLACLIAALEELLPAARGAPAPKAGRAWLAPRHAWLGAVFCACAFADLAFAADWSSSSDVGLVWTFFGGSIVALLAPHLVWSARVAPADADGGAVAALRTRARKRQDA